MNQENKLQRQPSQNGAEPNGASRGDALVPEQSAVTFRPNVGIVNAGDEVLIFADLPGAEPDGSDVRFERGVLELKAKVAPRAAGRTRVLEEYRVGDFQRSFRLPEEFNGSGTSAEFQNGVLCLRVPKSTEARAHRIQVQAG